MAGRLREQTPAVANTWMRGDDMVDGTPPIPHTDAAAAEIRELRLRIHDLETGFRAILAVGQIVLDAGSPDSEGVKR